MTGDPEQPTEALKRIMRGEPGNPDDPDDDFPNVGGTDPVELVLHLVREKPGEWSPRSMEEFAPGGSRSVARIVTQQLLDEGRLILDDHLKLRVFPLSVRLDDQDATAWLRAQPAESADLCVFDPAYESLEKHRARGTTTRLKVSKGSSNEWFPIFPDVRFPEFFVELYRVMKKDTHTYMFCDKDTMFVTVPMAKAAGFTFWKPLVWHKLGRIGLGYHYRAKYEFVLFFEKGKRRLHDLGISDVLEFPRVMKGYPTEKPVDLIRVLIRQSSEPRALVIDPFFGSGAVGDAAIKEGCAFAGTDISPAAMARAKQRLT